MTITQTIEIPDDRRISINVPPEIPVGKIVLTFSPVDPVLKSAKEEAVHSSSAQLPGRSARTVDEALQMAAEKAADPKRKPISRHFGTLSKHSFGDPVAYQRAIRDEWD